MDCLKYPISKKTLHRSAPTLPPGRNLFHFKVTVNTSFLLKFVPAQLLWKLFYFLTDLVECLTVLKCYWCDNLWTIYWHNAEQQLISHQFRGKKSLWTYCILLYGLIYDGSKWFRISLWIEMQNRGQKYTRPVKVKR